MRPCIRPMTPEDVAPAAEVVLRGEWGDRTALFGYATTSPACRGFVAEIDGAIAGTGVATVNGRAGWVGAIFVTAAARGRGLGTALTEAVIEELEAAGCSSLVLVATEQGRPLYEKLGFRIQTRYHVCEREGLGPDAPPVPGVRPLTSADIDAAVALDRIATGEDRRHLLAAFADEPGALALDGTESGLAGFVIRSPWGGAAIVARDADAALRLLEARRALSGPDRRIRAGVPTENEDGRRRLVLEGWHEGWAAVRMVRGEPPLWRPDMIWGQLSYATG